jgi:hypothetical protein
MNNIKIDPCSACLDYYDITDINNINSCCYNTLGAFLNKNNINEIKNTPEAKNCFNCVQRSIRALGRDPCEFRLSPPPIISTSPHFLPYILKDEPDLNNALSKCLNMCQNSEECIKNCNIDALSVKYGQQLELNTSSDKISISQPVSTQEPPVQTKESYVDPGYKRETDWFLLYSVIFGFFIAFILLIFTLIGGNTQNILESKRIE